MPADGSSTTTATSSRGRFAGTYPTKEAVYLVCEYTASFVGYVPANRPRLLVAVVDRKSTRLKSSHRCSSYSGFCLKKKKRLPRGRGSYSRRLGGGAFFPSPSEPGAK